MLKQRNDTSDYSLFHYIEKSFLRLARVRNFAVRRTFAWQPNLEGRRSLESQGGKKRNWLNLLEPKKENRKYELNP